jgi:lipopolysaccharide export system protein LptC
LLLLLGGAYWLNQQLQPLPARDDPKKRHDPDAISGRITISTLDSRGQLHHTLSAQGMTHYPDDDSIYFDQPRLTSHSPGQPSSHVSANQGVSLQQEEILLNGDVRVIRDASAGYGERVFTSPSLRVLPEQDYAETDQAVTLTDDHNRIHAIGMKMDNRAHTVQLLSQVRSEHAPNR